MILNIGLDYITFGIPSAIMADVLDLNAEDFVEEDDGNIYVFISYAP